MDQLRIDFEKWVATKYSIYRDGYGFYISNFTQSSWLAWQEATRQAKLPFVDDNK